MSGSEGRCCRFVFVEDTYGVDFHRRLIDHLHGEGRISILPRVRRLPAKKCNPKVFRSIRGATVGCRRWRVLVVIDQEAHETPRQAAERDFLRHVKKNRDRFRVVVVQPRHEAWLCIGLGLDRKKCRKSPESVIEAIIGEPYDKRFLSKLSSPFERRFDPARLEGESDFSDYMEALLWLSEC